MLTVPREEGVDPESSLSIDFPEQISNIEACTGMHPAGGLGIDKREERS